MQVHHYNILFFDILSLEDCCSSASYLIKLRLISVLTIPYHNKQIV